MLGLILYANKKVVHLWAYIACRALNGYVGGYADIMKSVYLTFFLDDLKSRKFLWLVKNEAAVDALWICNIMSISVCEKQIDVLIIHICVRPLQVARSTNRAMREPQVVERAASTDSHAFFITHWPQSGESIGPFEKYETNTERWAAYTSTVF